MAKTMKTPATGCPTLGTPAKPDVFEVAQAAVDTASQLLEAATAIVLKMACGVDVSSDEQNVIRALGWSEKDVEKHVGRAKVALRCRKEAGTTADLEAAAKRVEQAAAKSRAEKPGLEAALAETQAKIHTLDAEVKTATREEAARATARKRLRQYAPQHLRQRYSEAEVRVTKWFHRATTLPDGLGSMESRIKMIEGVTKLTLPNDESKIIMHVSAIKRSGEMVKQSKTFSVTDKRGREVNIRYDTEDQLREIVAANPEWTLRIWLRRESVTVALWEKYKQDLLAELPKLEGQYGELCKERDSQMAETESELDEWATSMCDGGT